MQYYMRYEFQNSDLWKYTFKSEGCKNMQMQYECHLQIFESCIKMQYHFSP